MLTLALLAHLCFPEPTLRIVCTVDPETWDLNHWLDSMKFSNYVPNFLNEGYDRLDAVCARIRCVKHSTTHARRL